MDIKSWVIVTLFAIAIVFAGLWYFKGDDGSKQKVKDLEQQISKIEKAKTAADLIISSLQATQKELESTISSKTAELAVIEKNNIVLSSQVSSVRQNLDALRKKLKETEAKITELTNNPIKRDGDELINSLKNNTK